MDISIIIPTYNRNNLLYKHIAVAYRELKGLDYEIIVINDSKTNIVQIAYEWEDKVYVINNTKQGVASARNLGATIAKAELLIFVDDDVIINRKAVERAIEYLGKNKNVSLNVDWVYPPELRKKLNTYQFGRYLEHFGFTTLRGWIGPDFDWHENTVVKSKGIASYFLAISKESF
jgi:glycosyltransferase involved in cell wall biosynthesis